MPNEPCDDRVTYPAKNDNAFIEFSEAAKSAKKALALGDDGFTGKSPIPSSKTIIGGQNAHA